MTPAQVGKKILPTRERLEDKLVVGLITSGLYEWSDPFKAESTEYGSRRQVGELV